MVRWWVGDLEMLLLTALGTTREQHLGSECLVAGRAGVDRGGKTAVRTDRLQPRMQ